MDKLIAEYLRKELISFYEFMITYEGNLAKKWVTDISIRVTEEEDECSLLTNSEAFEIIDKFIEVEKRKRNSD